MPIAKLFHRCASTMPFRFFELSLFFHRFRLQAPAFEAYAIHPHMSAFLNAGLTIAFFLPVSGSGSQASVIFHMVLLKGSGNVPLGRIPGCAVVTS